MSALTMIYHAMFLIMVCMHEVSSIMAFTFGISYVLNVCEYIQKYSLACPWLFTWPDLEEDELLEENCASEADA